MSYSSYETHKVSPIHFLDYHIYRTEDCRIQIDEEMSLEHLSQGKWKEGDHLLVEVIDNKITLTKVNVV